jgi:aminoglycoside phosphotransferase (APT) family kinase protein
MGSGGALASVRARRALADAGLDATEEIARASSATNEVWLTPTYVVRVTGGPNTRLRREGELAPFLPASARYPPIIAQGRRGGTEWLVLERVPGGPLARAWPEMSHDQRRSAVWGLAGALRGVHRTREPVGLPPADRPPHALSLTEVPATAPLERGLERVREMPHVDQGMITEATLLLRETSDAIEPFASPTLIHGDLTFENVLWHEDTITALLDFEWARAAPADLDLDILMRFCGLPFLHVAEDYAHLAKAADYREVPGWLADAYPELFDRARLMDRLRIYALAYDVRDLLEHPPHAPATSLSEHHPLNRMRRTLERRSYLDQLVPA